MLPSWVQVASSHYKRGLSHILNGIVTTIYDFQKLQNKATMTTFMCKNVINRGSVHGKHIFSLEKQRTQRRKQFNDNIYQIILIM